MNAVAPKLESHVLRPYQSEIYKRFRESTAARILVVLPTGTGKTWVAVRAILDAVASGERVLFLAHRRHIVSQAIDRLIAAGVSRGTIGDEDAIAVAPVVVGSVQTLCRRAIPPTFDLVIIDEAHHAVAKTWKKVIDASGASRVLGLTATPIRLDGRGLGDLFDEIVRNPSDQALRDDGFLADPRVFSISADQAEKIVRGVKRRGGDYDRKKLEERYSAVALVANPVTEWKKHANGLPTLLYAIGKKHAKVEAKRFKRAGITAEIVTGETDERERNAIISRVRLGKTKVVVSIEVFGEGLDCDAFRCAILRRPTLSLGLYRQQCGRVLRPGSVQPVILDHAGNALVHDHPNREFTWSLTKTGVVGAVAPTVHRCKACGEIWVDAKDDAGNPLAPKTCAACGAEVETIRRITRSRRGWLVELINTAKAHPSLDAVVIKKRIMRGWSISSAMSTPRSAGNSVLVRTSAGEEFNSIAEASRKLGVAEETISRRIRRGYMADQSLRIRDRSTRCSTSAMAKAWQTRRANGFVTICKRCGAGGHTRHRCPGLLSNMNKHVAS